MTTYQGLQDALIESSMVSGFDDQVGSTSEAPGFWAAIFRRVNGSTDDVDAILGKTCDVGAILYCDSDGFYSYETFSDIPTMEATWSGVESDAAIGEDDDVESTVSP